MSDINIKHLISPFLFVPSALPPKQKQAPRPSPWCRCDSDDQEMAPECAFICNNVVGPSHKERKTTKKRRAHVKKTHTKRIARNDETKK